MPDVPEHGFISRQLYNALSAFFSVKDAERFKSTCDKLAGGFVIIVLLGILFFALRQIPFVIPTGGQPPATATTTPPTTTPNGPVAGAPCSVATDHQSGGVNAPCSDHPATYNWDNENSWTATKSENGHYIVELNFSAQGQLTTLNRCLILKSDAHIYSYDEPTDYGLHRVNALSVWNAATNQSDTSIVPISEAPYMWRNTLCFSPPKQNQTIGAEFVTMPLHIDAQLN